MRTRLLLSASFVVLIGSLGLARADTYDDAATYLSAAVNQMPADERSTDTVGSIKAVNDSVSALNAAKAKAAAAAADLAKAQAVAGIGSVSPDQAYQAQANKVANQLDVIDGLKKMADSGNIKKNLDDAIATQKTAEYWNNKAAQSVKDTANLSPTDPKRKEALDGYANANKLMAQAQYLAGVAADAASAALKDPQSADAQLRAKIVSATSDYNDLKSGLDTLNNVKNATVAVQRANADVADKKADATAKGVTALNFYNADLKKAEAAKQAAADAAAAKQAAAAAAAKPVVASGAAAAGSPGGPALAATTSTGGAPLIGNAGGALVSNSGGTLIGNAGGALISNNANKIVSHDGGTVVSNDGGSVLSHDAGSLISNTQGGLISNNANKIISDNSEGLISNKAAGIVSENGAGIVSEHGAGLISNSASAMMHIMSVSAAATTSSNAFKSDSRISAFSNTEVLSPSEQLAANVRNNLSAADQKTLNAMITDVKAGKTLTAAQETQAAALLNQAAKGLDPATVKSLQQSATVKAAVVNANAAVTASVVNQAITTAKNDPAVVAAVQNLQAGKPLTAAQKTSLNTAIASTVNSLQVSDTQKQSLTQTATTQVATATVSKAALASTTPAAVTAATYSPVVAQQLVTAGPAVIQGLQSQQAAATARGDKTLADALGRDITSLQGEIATAKTIVAAAPAAGSVATAATAKPVAPAGTTTAVAPAGTATAAVNPAAVTATPSGPTLASAPAKTEEAPARITAEQGKAVHQALRTIPGNLSSAEQKNFATLSTLVDRATTKGLTPEEAVTLKAGLAALAEKHPKAEKQVGLAAIGNGIGTAKKPEGPAVATTRIDPVAPTGTKAAPAPAEAKAIAAPTGSSPGVKPAVAVTEPAKTVHTDEFKQHTASPAVAAKTPVQPVVAPKVQPAAAPAPSKPALAASTTTPVKLPAAPAAKPQTCTPNMVNGKQVGMTCR